MSASPIYATQAHAGQVCILCQQPITLHQLIRLDHPSGGPVHLRCWEGSGAINEPAPAFAPTAQPAAPIPAAQAEEQLPGSRGKIALLIAAGVIPLLGPMLGIVVGFIWLDPKGHPVRRRDGRELLIFSVVLFIYHLINLACTVGWLMDELRSGNLMSPMGF